MKYASITCTIHPSQVHGGLKEDCDVIAPVKAFMEVPVGKPTKEITVPLKLLPVILPVRRLEVHTTHVHPTSLPSPRKTQTRTCDMHYHRRVYCNNSGCGHHRASMVLSVGGCGCAAVPDVCLSGVYVTKLWSAVWFARHTQCLIFSCVDKISAKVAGKCAQKQEKQEEFPRRVPAQTT